ncbi:16S rRNA (cytidine(1402)-2'-O)-methyltransferase [Burkholderia glumae]|uniref:Ribosomal RNA small subunit methyltransferase I n=3 Tax=Burkholderia glumae TaxID=337 RepID=A0AAQ0BSX6_BURGL|nr:16S rRNA (cytidine(1402)-2'-O)-methyltransferase [Burkholderia glumae]ACR27414.1 Uroporphyrin-III C/tetrapyrrole(Corrin/Porphyrin) methyltransferase [Burkholderia glumae BGR1]AJY65752.1 16S rRNA (cytidine(1402)-2'-O)-methyltransferase [Burkholderia glumae LMG 2196 = ATCC 33617]MCM2481627.1 16S rRNA (cytidine(1402)-2'-O)-methyltransferase [Burkholderia glumae]MCM2491739.1 16S rRNA (cytidine(1402)-2'-O)-methyltransferase [Burkholderia glumae]MCM2508233.1 16S rRNA (cytidine(1402)-2'-O)-methylt
MTSLPELAHTQHYPAGTLYVVATPIGNAADITLRALHVLALVDRIAAEDTRNTGQLLARYGISKPLVAVHEHNEREAAGRLVEQLRAGERIAYVSDAGTPGISDPGAKLVDAVRAAGLPVVPLPGANAAATALSIAGDWAGPFTFAGFLPPKAKQRAAALATLKAHPYALVFYEAPHRIAETIDALADAFGTQRRVLIARELTKLHEDVFAGTLAEGPGWLAGDPNRQRGEFAVVVEGASAPSGEHDPHAHDALLTLLLSELPVKGAAKLAAALTGASRSTLYARALELKEQEGRGARDA